MHFRLPLALCCSILITGCLNPDDDRLSETQASHSTTTEVNASTTGDGTEGTTGKQPVQGDCEPEATSKKVFKAVNQARSEPRYCGSDYYEAAPALSYSCQLEIPASDHSQDMASDNFFSHIGSDGLRVPHRVSAANYSWQAVGENIAAGFSGVEGVMTAWLDSPGHCRNIMNDRYTEFAVVVKKTSAADYSNYWTQVFALPD